MFNRFMSKILRSFILVGNVCIIFGSIVLIAILFLNNRVSDDMIYLILGAILAGIVGMTSHVITSYMETSDMLKKIKKRLNYEAQTIINTLNRNINELEYFTNKGDLSQERNKDEIKDIKQKFELGCPYLKTPLRNGIYSNNNVFNMKDDELKNIQDTQTYIDNYNDTIKSWYDMAAKLTEQEPVDNIKYQLQLAFLFKHKQLNEDLVKNLENMSQLN